MKPYFLLLTLSLLLFTTTYASERLLYTTSLHDWGTYPSVLTPDSFSVTTRYSEEQLTFSFQQVLIRQDGCSSSFYEGRVHPLAMTERKATPYIATSPLRSVTRIRMMQGATGGNCGFRVEAWGDGDGQWVTLLDSRLNSGMHEDEIEVNRTNVRLRLSNLSSSQNDYLFELDIYGDVPDEAHPRLSQLSYEGLTFVPGDVVSRSADDVLEGTLLLSKQLAMPSAEHPLHDIQVIGGTLARVNYQPVSPLRTDVTLVVKSPTETQRYLLHCQGKPDHTLTYCLPDGRVLATQQVEEDRPIHHFDCTQVPAAEGQRFRGWFDDPRIGHAITPAHIVREPMTLYARISDIEGAGGTRRWFYDLRNPDFRPEHHEAFQPQGTYSYVGRGHGWRFEAGATLRLLVGSDAYIAIGACMQQPEGSHPVLLIGQDSLTLTPRAEGERLLYHHQSGGSAHDWLTLHFLQPTILHSVTIDNVEGAPIEPDASGYYCVRAGDVEHLLATLDVVNHRNAQPDAAPARIWIPEGDYDMGVTSLMPISGHNISLIGQSQEGTIIRNLPWIEGIGTATLLNLGNNNYLQDLTLQNDLDYYADTEAGRAPCLQDCGTHTICKQVRMLSYQDTYYSCAHGQQLYWEDCELHGSFDFLCGRGTVFYNRVHLVLESMEREEGRGEAIITAPYTAEGDMGYVFDHCRVTVCSRTFNWGRAWGGNSHCAFLYTTIPSGDRLIPTRYEPEGMNSAATDFYEYETRDEEGRLVTPPSNVVHFTHQNGDQTFETILTPERAQRYSLRNIFPQWQPDVEAQQVTASDFRMRRNRLTWTAPSHSVAQILVDGHIVAWVKGNSYKSSFPLQGHEVSIRLSNGRGGFGPAVCLVDKQ